MALDPIIPGAAWAAQLERESGEPFTPSANRVLLVLDSPAKPSPQVRIIREYTPGGPNPTGVSASGDAVRFVLSSEDTEHCEGRGGLWQVFVLVGAAGEQYPALPRVQGTVTVLSPNGGAVPNG